MPTFYSQLKKQSDGSDYYNISMKSLNTTQNKKKLFTSIGLLFIIANKMLLASVALNTPKSMNRSSILGGSTKY